MLDIYRGDEKSYISFDNFLTTRWHLVIKSYIISRWKKKNRNNDNFHPILNSSFLIPEFDIRITSIFLVKLINNLNRDFSNFIKRADKKKKLSSRTIEIKLQKPWTWTRLEGLRRIGLDSSRWCRRGHSWRNIWMVHGRMDGWSHLPSLSLVRRSM